MSTGAPVNERVALGNILRASLAVANHSVEQSWGEEVVRRIEDLKAGRAFKLVHNFTGNRIGGIPVFAAQFAFSCTDASEIGSLQPQKFYIQEWN